MKQTIWQRFSRTGLRDDEGVFGHREVILLNKILTIAPIAIALMIPVEIAVNGFDLVPLELIFMGLVLVPLYMQKKRMFRAARFYSLVVSNLFIIAAGVFVGKGINNHLAMIPIMLFGLFLFRSTRDRLVVFGLSLLFYTSLQVLLQHIQPAYNIGQQSREIFSHIFYILSLLLTFLLGYYFLGINAEYEALILEQKESIAMKSREITDSITYAKRIQEARLADRSELAACFPGSFLIYQPKDIVSGDFYFLKRKEDKVLIAVADCTGHGVPGALMSMIASEKLSEAMNMADTPARILELTNQGIKRSLRQHNSSDATRDGMDLALCAINLSSLTLSYSGANRPLWLIRHDQKTLEEIKPDKKALGGITDFDTQFTEHKTGLKAGDTIYLFTDGYADQFNGRTGKKLMTRKMKELLSENSHLPMAAQAEKLEIFLRDWRSGTEQVDDILVLGIQC